MTPAKGREKGMKIAIASSDGVSISQHFGRSAAWMIFEIEEGKIAGKEIRPNTHSHHAAEGCGGHDHADGGGQHSHDGLIGALRDCNAILCAGMGRRAAEDLKRHGIEPFIVNPAKTPEEAVAMYIGGELSSDAQNFCCGRHHQ